MFPGTLLTVAASAVTPPGGAGRSVRRPQDLSSPHFSAKSRSSERRVPKFVVKYLGMLPIRYLQQ
jgi:hypothetical protein